MEKEMSRAGGVVRLALVLFVISLIPLLSPRIQNADTARDVEYWRTRIEMKGADISYEEFAHEISAADSGEQHNEAHMFGDALYAAKGVGGIITCDDRFSYGCFHEFLGRAIASEGLAVVPSLNAACNGNDGCQHGIGHGIQSYFGYSEDSLQETLRACRALPDNRPMLGCSAGAVMEFNLRTMLGSVPTNMRIPDVRGPLYPCDLLQGDDRNACLLWQPQWWWVYFNDHEHMPSGVALQNMRRFCDGLTDREERDICDGGIGMRVPPAASYDALVSADLCDATFPIERERTLCQAYAAAVFFSAVSEDDAPLVCSGLQPASKVYCEAYASGRASIAHKEELPTI